MAMLFAQLRSKKDLHDPVSALSERSFGLEGQVACGEVVELPRGKSICEVVENQGRRLSAGKVVVHSGAFSARLAKAICKPIPMQTECSNPHTTHGTQDFGKTLDHLARESVQVRLDFRRNPVAGTMEMAGVVSAPDYRHAKVTISRAREALPNLKCGSFAEWMGHRTALYSVDPAGERPDKVADHAATGSHPCDVWHRRDVRNDGAPENPDDSDGGTG